MIKVLYRYFQLPDRDYLLDTILYVSTFAS